MGMCRKHAWQMGGTPGSSNNDLQTLIGSLLSKLD